MYNKINGFHVGMPAKADGIDNYLQSLANNNIPFSAKAVSNTSSLIKAQELLQAGHKGLAIWRLDRYDDSDNDVPRYGTDVNIEADRIWNSVLERFPPELNKEYVWVELINEPDKNQSDWLGYLAVELGQRALRDGYKLLCFGWSSGEPELEHWLTNGMQAYLNLVRQNPNQLGVSVHEYSYDINNIMNTDGWLVGRILKVYETVGFEFTTAITEWGYTYNDVPTDTNKVMRDIISVGELYNVPEILGVQIWALDLGANWNDIGNKVNHWMTPLVETIKNNPYPDNDETFDEFLIRVAEENRKINYNTQAALQKKIVQDNLWIYSNETWTNYNGTQYAVQGAFDSVNDKYYTYYCKVGDWGNIQRLEEGR